MLENQEELEDELDTQASAVDLDAESDDGDEAQGDGTLSDGSPTLIDDEFISPESISILSQVLNSPSPAERDSALLLDADFNDQGNFPMKLCTVTISYYCSCI